MRIVFLGDIMISGDQNMSRIIVSDKHKNVLKNADFRIATFESALGCYAEIDSYKQLKSEVAVWSKKEDLHKISDLGINVVSLANNHSCDCGIESMLSLKKELYSIGVVPIGAGKDLKEAMQPAILEINGESLAIIGLCEDNPKALGNLHFATENQGGLYKYDELRVKEQIKQLKSSYTYVAVVVHWGVEHKWLPESDDVAIGKKMIEAGADMIIGGHPHHVQPVLKYKGKPICFSLGNYYFPDFCLDKVSNTFYPEFEEMKKLPVFDWMAPDRRNFAMKYFWKYYGRLGMIASICVKPDNIDVRSIYSIYKKGTLSISKIGLLHNLSLKMLRNVCDKHISVTINKYITIIGFIFETKILSIFFKKYRFFRYLKRVNKA